MLSEKLNEKESENLSLEYKKQKLKNTLSTKQVSLTEVSSLNVAMKHRSKKQQQRVNMLSSFTHERVHQHLSFQKRKLFQLW